MLNLDDYENIKDIEFYASSMGFVELGGAIEEKISGLRAKVEACAAEGRMLVKKGEYTAAHQAYDQGLRLDPNSGRLYFNKGRLFLRMGELEKCFNYMERALEFGLANRDAELVAKVAQTYLEQENFPRTRRILESAQEMNLDDESIVSVVDMLQAKQPETAHALTG
jgi:tetratricopeptide (TPR) repeat protein